MFNHGNNMTPLWYSDFEDFLNSSSHSLVNHTNADFGSVNATQHLQGDSQEAKNVPLWNSNNDDSINSSSHSHVNYTNTNFGSANAGQHLQSDSQEVKNVPLWNSNIDDLTNSSSHSLVNYTNANFGSANVANHLQGDSQQAKNVPLWNSTIDDLTNSSSHSLVNHTNANFGSVNEAQHLQGDSQEAKKVPLWNSNNEDLTNSSSHSLVNYTNANFGSANGAQHLQGDSQEAKKVPLWISNIEELTNSPSHSLVNHTNADFGSKSALQGDSQEANNEEEKEDEDDSPIDIVITNVVCSFNVNCQLDLRKISRIGINVEHKPGSNMLTMKISRPYSTANMWATGKVTCAGTTTEAVAKISARRFARILEGLGYDVKFNNYRVVNVKGTCIMPFAIDIIPFCRSCPEADYEPELRSGVKYKMDDPKATLMIFSSGKVIAFAQSVANVKIAVEHVFQLIFDFFRRGNSGALVRQRET